MSANDLPDNRTLILKELDVPGRTGPVSEGPPKVWGLNNAALEDNFPRQGLLCRAGPWEIMRKGDTLVVYRDLNTEVLRKIVEQHDVDKELTLFVPSTRILEGRSKLSYAITRQDQTEEPSLVMEVLAKRTRPGGHDDTEEPGHPKLIMTIPKEILEGGIDKDNVAAGVLITIGASVAGTPPYPNAAAGDVIQVTWGGVFVLSKPLTPGQADGKVPIIVHITEEAIRKAGDSDDVGLAVAYEVYDEVDNRSEDWSAEQRVVVAIDATRLAAPLLKQAVNNVLDVDKLGDADGTAQVLAVDTSKFEVGDRPIIWLKGTPLEGAPINIEIPGEPLVSVPSIPEVKIANALLRQLAKAQLALSYRLEKANGSPDLRAKTQFISVIGQVQRLAAPVALDAEQGALDPALPQVRIEIPFDTSFAAGQAIKLFWLGTRSDLTPYLPDLPLRPITAGDIAAGVPLLIIVAGEHLTPLNGGTLELYYHLLIEDEVLATMNRVNVTHAIRESVHAEMLRVGEPRLELPEPEVAGVVNGALDPDAPGTTLTVTYLNTLTGDEVFRQWIGSKTGTDEDSVKLTSFTAGKEVPFTIKAELIKGNEGGTVKAQYHIKRAAGGTSYSNPLEFSVGVVQPVTIPVGQRPFGVTFIPDGSHAYVANFDSRSVSVINTQSQSVIKTIPVGSGSYGIAIHPDGSRAYVTNGTDSSISVIDIHSQSVINTIPIGSAPSAIVIHPDGSHVYVNHHNSDSVSVIETRSQSVIKTIPVGRNPYGIAIHPDGFHAYVNNRISNSVSVIDIWSQSVIKTIPVGELPVAIAVHPDGTRAYVANYDSRSVSEIDTRSQSVIKTIPVGSRLYGIAIHPDGTRAYVTNYDSGSVSEIDTQSQSVIKTIPVGAAPAFIAVHPDGTRLYVTNVDDGTVSIVAAG